MNTRQKALISQIRQAIETIGWHSIAVFDAGVPFMYSQGFRKLQHPDILVSGLPPAVAHQFIGDIFTLVQGGAAFVPGIKYDTIAEGYDAQVREVHPTWRDELCIITGAVYGNHNFDVLQLIYPDRYGRWPWNAACVHAVRAGVLKLDVERDPMSLVLPTYATVPPLAHTA